MKTNCLVGVPWTILANIGSDEKPCTQYQFHGWSVHKTKKDAEEFIIEQATTEPHKYYANGSIGMQMKNRTAMAPDMIMNGSDQFLCIYYAEHKVGEELVAGFLKNPKGIMYNEWCPYGFTNSHIQRLRDLRERDTDEDA